MSEDIKYISIKEFRELGLVQEINRQFLHPRGLALEVIIDKETGDVKLGGVWDYRDDPEGMIFGEGIMTEEKFNKCQKLLADKEKYRQKELGWVIQPIE